MAAGGMTGDVNAIAVAAEFFRVVVDPGHCATHLPGHRHQVAGDVVDIVEVDYDAMRTGLHEQFPIQAEVGGAAVSPGAAMDVDIDRGIRAPGLVNINAFDLARAVLKP